MRESVDVGAEAEPERLPEADADAEADDEAAGALAKIWALEKVVQELMGGVKIDPPMFCAGGSWLSPRHWRYDVPIDA